jgi:hypothetical protein
MRNTVAAEAFESLSLLDMTKIILERSMRGARPVVITTDCDRRREQVTDRDIEEELAFHRKRQVSTKVRTTDTLTTPAMEFSALKLLNEKMRTFWEKSAEGGRL